MLTLAALGLMACRPPEAPDTFDEMMVFGFVHFDDEDPASLQSLGEKLIPWMDAHLDETLDGYEIAAMSDESLAEAGVVGQGRGDILGVAVGLDYSVDIQALADGITSPDQDEIFDIYIDFERTSDMDRGCFLARDCERYRTEDSLHSDVGLGIELWTDYRTNFRNVDLDDGTRLLLHQAITDQPIEFNIDSLSVYQQYGFSLAWDRGGSTRRAQAIWADMEFLDGDLGENLHLSLTISSMKRGAEDMDAYLSGDAR